MIISIDYDDTFTVNQEMWLKIIQIWESEGFKVVCCTARRDTFDNRKQLQTTLPETVNVYFAYDCPKRQYMEYRGVDVDIWIDDSPEAICSHKS